MPVNDISLGNQKIGNDNGEPNVVHMQFGRPIRYDDDSSMVDTVVPRC